MSPIGGVGVNLAVQDAVAAANRLAAPLKAGTVSDDDLRAIQARRTFPVRFTQALQLTMQKRIISRALASTQRPKPPLLFKLFDVFPVLQRIPGRLLAVGVRPEHVHTPDMLAVVLVTPERSLPPRADAKVLDIPAEGLLAISAPKFASQFNRTRAKNRGDAAMTMTEENQSESRPFEADVAKLLHLMVHSVYSEKSVFLRELISNAADACERLRYEAIAEPALLGDDPKPRITLTVDAEQAAAHRRGQRHRHEPRGDGRGAGHHRPLRHQGVSSIASRRRRPRKRRR